MYHKEFTCCHDGCMGLICLTPEQEARFRRDHRDFRCPMGHVQGFYGPSAEEKKIKLLEQRLEFYKGLANHKQALLEEARFEMRSLRARLGAKTRKLNHYRTVHSRYNTSEKGRERARRYREAHTSTTKSAVG